MEGADKLAVLLVRVSSKEQEMEGYSLEAQERVIRHYTASVGLAVDPGVFRISETASKKDQRKTFDDMMSYIKKHKRRHLVCEKVDRLLRNFKDTVMVEDWLEADENRRLHLVKNSIVLHRRSSSQEKFVWGMHVVVAKNYTDNLREEVAKGWLEKLRQGWLPGVPPLGYMNVGEVRKKIQVIDEQTAPLIRQMFELAATGLYSVKTLLKEMTERGLRTRNGRPLSPSHLHKLIHNPYYIGQIVWDGQVYAGNHEPLISRQLFQTVQQVTRRSHVPKFMKHHPLFQGLVTCGRCQGLVTWEQQKTHWYGRCKRDGCQVGRPYVRQERLEQQVHKAMKALEEGTPGLVRWLGGQLRETVAQEVVTRDAGIRNLQERERELNRRVRELYIDKLELRVSAELHDELLAELKREKKDIVRSIEKLLAGDTSYLERGLEFVDISQDAAREFQLATDTEAKRRLIGRLFTRLVLTDGCLACEYNPQARCVLQKVQRSREESDFEPAYFVATEQNGAASWTPHSHWLGLLDDFRSLFME